MRDARGRVGTCICLAALCLTACGKHVIETAPTERFVVDVVAQQNDFEPTDVSCPEGLQAEVGLEFDCRFTGPESTVYLAHLSVVGVKDDLVTFNLKQLTPVQ